MVDRQDLLPFFLKISDAFDALLRDVVVLPQTAVSFHGVNRQHICPFQPPQNGVQGRLGQYHIGLHVLDDLIAVGVLILNGCQYANTQSDYMDIIFNNGETDNLDGTYGIMAEMPKDTAVQVTILHVPSNKAVYDKEVVVQ